jgi:hypothetical protein
LTAKSVRVATFSHWPLGSHLLLTLALGTQAVKVSTRTDFVVQPRDRVWMRPEQGALRLLGRLEED